MPSIDRARAQMLAAGMPEFPPGHPVVADRIIRYGPKKRAWYILRELVLRSGRVVVVGGFGIWGRMDPQKIEVDWQGFSDDERAETKRKYEEAERARRRRPRSARTWRRTARRRNGTPRAGAVKLRTSSARA
jgi:putative DNA primase/helicase